MTMEYVLDYSTWRCGHSSEHKLGEGETRLLNEQGYMCCLGQFARQVGVPEACLKGKVYPQQVEWQGKPYDPLFVDGLGGTTGEAMAATTINDSEKTTPQEKIVVLRDLLEYHGHTLKVINEPEAV